MDYSLYIAWLKHWIEKWEKRWKEYNSPFKRGGISLDSRNCQFPKEGRLTIWKGGPWGGIIAFIYIYIYIHTYNYIHHILYLSHIIYIYISITYSIYTYSYIRQNMKYTFTWPFKHRRRSVDVGASKSHHPDPRSGTFLSSFDLFQHLFHGLSKPPAELTVSSWTSQRCYWDMCMCKYTYVYIYIIWWMVMVNVYNIIIAVVIVIIITVTYISSLLLLQYYYYSY